MQLRWYQTKALDDLDAGWSAGHKCQALRMGTGTGKSATSAAAIRDHGAAALMMAHRSEIVGQLSLALAREGIRHRVIGTPALARLCREMQIDDLGSHWVDGSSRVGVASVQTLAAIKGEDAYLRQVTFAVADEHHHYLTDNQFGRALGQLPAACRILGPTATPARTDGKGLGRHASGFVDHMVLGPTEAEMMEQGFLSPYKIYAPPNDFHRDQLHTNASGEFKADEVKQETRKSTIFGDAVQHYLSHAPGTLALQFCDSIENATLASQKFRDAGVSSEVLSGKTDPDVRRRVLKQFAKRQILHIASVSLIDEGFDCPAVETVLDTAPTTSLIKFRQRFGRGWRPAEGKLFRYFDFVANVFQHGLPDAYREWNLSDRERRGSNGPTDAVPVTTCLNPLCLSVYERALDACPYCGHVRLAAQRGGPKQVDGVLQELDAASLAAMRGQYEQVRQAPRFPMGATAAIRSKLTNDWRARLEALAGIERTVALWNGWQVHHLGRSETEAQRRFFYRYGVDLITAQSLPARESLALDAQVRAELAERGIIDGSVTT